MELYLRWLEKHDTRPGEEPPLGLILCADKSDEHVELLRLNKSGIRVARYLTELPARELLEKTLHESIRRARERLAPKKHDRSKEAAKIEKRPKSAGKIKPRSPATRRKSSRGTK